MENASFRAGLEEVAAAETAISTLERGLHYRGYAIEDLAEFATFEETAYLLWHGELPHPTQLLALRQRLGQSMTVEPRLIEAMATLPAGSVFMDATRTAVCFLAHADFEVADNGRAASLRKAERILGQLPVLVAAAHRARAGLAPVAAQPERGVAYNVLRLLRGGEPRDWETRAMETSLIAYADHEMNASTFTARVVASTQADLHAAITAALAALKGPLHGGANERVLDVLEAAGSPDTAEGWVRTALSQKRRIFGFGHRVYRDRDPRAELLKPLCTRLARETGHERLEQTAEVVEQVVRDVKGLPPNVDWPSARLYRYLGLPGDLYTPLFALSRVVGWSAHVMEQYEHNRLISPRANYVGCRPRSWVPLERR